MRIPDFRFPDPQRADYLAQYGEEGVRRLEQHVTERSRVIAKEMWEGTSRIKNPKGIFGS